MAVFGQDVWKKSVGYLVDSLLPMPIAEEMDMRELDDMEIEFAVPYAWNLEATRRFEQITLKPEANLFLITSFFETLNALDRLGFEKAREAIEYALTLQFGPVGYFSLILRMVAEYHVLKKIVLSFLPGVGPIIRFKTPREPRDAEDYFTVLELYTEWCFQNGVRTQALLFAHKLNAVDKIRPPIGLKDEFVLALQGNIDDMFENLDQLTSVRIRYLTWEEVGFLFQRARVNPLDLFFYSVVDHIAKWHFGKYYPPQLNARREIILEK